MSQRSPLVSQPDLVLEARFPSLLALIKISENSQLQWLGKKRSCQYCSSHVTIIFVTAYC